MAQSLSPAAAAAAAAVTRQKEQALNALLVRVRRAMSGFTGDNCTHIRLAAGENELVADLHTEEPEWTFYASAGGRLYMGTAELIAAQKLTDGIVDTPPVVEKVVPVAPVPPQNLWIPTDPTILEQHAERVKIPADLGRDGENTDVVALPTGLTFAPVPTGDSGADLLQLAPNAGPEVKLDLVDAGTTSATVAAEPLATSVQLPTSTKFNVCEVLVNKEKQRTVPVKTAIQQMLGFQVEACSAGGVQQLGRPMGFHGLLESAHVAFANHYGLELSPDDVWVTIAQGFAKLVNKDPEKYRDRFVTHQGKQTIKIRRDSFVMGSPDNDWAGCYGEFADRIGEHIGADNHGLMVSSFSTTGALELAVSNLVLMDTVQSYFVYVVETRCGIPFITLRGSAADWKKVLDKARGLASFGDLKFWLDDLLPILQQFVNAAEGKVDRDFWSSIYKSKSESGCLNLTGWLLKLLPLTKEFEGWDRTGGGKDVVNPLLGRPNTPPHIRRAEGGRLVAYYHDSRVDMGRDSDAIIATDLLPSSLSTVPFIWDYLGTKYDYKFVGGIVGYTQNADDLAVRPQMGWAVLPANAQAYRGW